MQLLTKKKKNNVTIYFFFFIFGSVFVTSFKHNGKPFLKEDVYLLRFVIILFLYELFGHFIRSNQVLTEDYLLLMNFY